MHLGENCCLWNGLGFCKLKWAGMKPTCKIKHNAVNQPVQISGHTYRKWKLEWASASVHSSVPYKNPGRQAKLRPLPHLQTLLLKTRFEPFPGGPRASERDIRVLSEARRRCLRLGKGLIRVSSHCCDQALLLRPSASKPSTGSHCSLNLSTESDLEVILDLARWLHAHLSWSALDCSCKTRWKRGPLVYAVICTPISWKTARCEGRTTPRPSTSSFCMGRFLNFPVAFVTSQGSEGVTLSSEIIFFPKVDGWKHGRMGKYSCLVT